MGNDTENLIGAYFAQAQPDVEMNDCASSVGQVKVWNDTHALVQFTYVVPHGEDCDWLRKAAATGAELQAAVLNMRVEHAKELECSID